MDYFPDKLRAEATDIFAKAGVPAIHKDVKIIP